MVNDLEAAAQLLITRVADYAHDWRTASADSPALAAVYADVSADLPPLDSSTLDSLFGLYSRAEEAEDTAQLWRHTTPHGSEAIEREAAAHAQHFFADVHHALTQAGLTGDRLPHYFLTDALEATA